jgi:nitrile hydratase
VRAIQSFLTEKGQLDPETSDAIVDYFENKIGPRNGASVVARAWLDAEFKKSCLKMARLPSARWFFQVPKAQSFTSSKTVMRYITSLFVRCAPAIRGRFWDCRQSGLNLHSTAPVW